MTSLNLVPKQKLGNEPFMFPRNTQNHENYRVRSAPQFWRVRRALHQTFSEQSLMSLRLSQNYEKFDGDIM
jgi:hypothetical protein